MTNQQHLLHYTWNVLLIGLVFSAHAQASYTPFFFNNHTQMCRCHKWKRCNSDGSCSPVVCQSPYIGHTCQHGRIGHIMSPPPKVDWTLLDNNDTSCLDNFDGNAHFLFKNPIHYIWIYIYRKYKKEIKPTLELLNNTKPQDLSQNMYLLALSDNSWLIKLRHDVMFDEIKLSMLPHDMCSLAISIGRNLATSSTPYIAQNFSSTMPQQPEARKAIDGDYVATGTTLMLIPPGSQWWRAKLKHAARINRIKVISYIVNTKCGSWTYKIQYKDAASSNVVTHQHSPTPTEYMTDINLVHLIQFNVSEVGIAFKKTKGVCNTKTAVKLCAVYIFGEFACPDKMYGPLCEIHCSHGCSREKCDPDWACPKECKQGWNGIWCNHSCRFRYGPRCEHDCSDNCAGVGDCDTNTGQCIQGCKPGFSTAQCTNACVQGSFGLNCTQICEQCRKNKTTNAHACDPATGECLLGCSHAYGGDYCEKIITVEDILSKVSKYHWAAFILLLILLLYKSITRTEEEASEEEVVAQEAPKNDEEKVEEVEEERLHQEEIPSPENTFVPEVILAPKVGVSKEHVEPKPKEEEQLHQPPIEVEPEEDVPEQGSLFADIFSMIPKKDSDEVAVINTEKDEMVNP